MLWPRAIGLDCCYLGLTFLKEVALADCVIDPFCGVGTVCAMANALGMKSIGVELSVKRCKKARALNLTEWVNKFDFKKKCFLGHTPLQGEGKGAPSVKRGDSEEKGEREKRERLKEFNEREFTGEEEEEEDDEEDEDDEEEKEYDTWIERGEKGVKDDNPDPMKGKQGKFCHPYVNFDNNNKTKIEGLDQINGDYCNSSYTDEIFSSSSSSSSSSNSGSSNNGNSSVSGNALTNSNSLPLVPPSAPPTYSPVTAQSPSSHEITSDPLLETLRYVTPTPTRKKILSLTLP
jgi:hypothetical protein